MKSERRHELQHNDLADWFLTTYESMLPYRTVIIFGTLLVVVAAVAWTIWRITRILRGHGMERSGDRPGVHPLSGGTIAVWGANLAHI